MSRADVLTVYGDLAERRLSPAPLVPTTVPPSLAPIDRTITPGSSRRRSGYALRLGGDGSDAIIVLERGAYKTISAALRENTRRLGFKAQRTRVRGRPGYLLTRRLGPTQRTLLWVEDGRVYTLATGTPRKVSLKQLRATATGLDHLGRWYIGAADPATSTEGNAVTTERTVSVQATWEAQCVAPDGSPQGVRVGSAKVTLLPHKANAFAFDIAPNQVDTDAWSGNVSGTIAPAAITLNIRATGSFDGLLCDSGPLSFAIPARSD